MFYVYYVFCVSSPNVCINCSNKCLLRAAVSAPLKPSLSCSLYSFVFLMYCVCF